jgi:hypothetical protein
MGGLATPEEILRSSSASIDDHALGLQFPACDWAGYFLFAALDGDGPCQAVNLGLLVGHMEGRDLRMPGMVGDPRRLVVIRSLVHDGVSYRSPDDASYTRSDLVYSRAGLDVQVADVARIRGRWPEFELYFVDPVHDVVYDLAGRAGHVHWVPDHVYSTLYSYVVFPDFAFEGTITVAGVVHEVAGVGGLDHVNGRNVASPSSPGVGCWQYDPISWEDGWASNALLFLGDAGEVVVGAGAVAAVGGSYHPCPSFAIRYLEVDEGGANSGLGELLQAVPRAWQGLLRGEGCELEYTARRIDVVAPDGRPVVEANAYFEAEGVLRVSGRPERSLRGRGYNEFMGGSLDLASLVGKEARR